VQANDTTPANNLAIATQSDRQKVVPIAKLQTLSSLKFEKRSNCSWDLSCTLSSLTVSDLISPHVEKSAKGHTLIGRKREGDTIMENSNEHTASVVICNTVSDEDGQAQATTRLDVDVSPLEVTYSTHAVEALSRLFAAVKTTEFNRDYVRLSRALSRWRSRQGKRLMTVLAARRNRFAAHISIAAPVLFVPEDRRNAEAPTLVIDLGRLIFQSSSDEALPFGFDDKWLLRIDNIRALCIQQQLTTSHEHAIIEPFSLKFSILTHIAGGEASTTDMTRISVQALLPQLCFNLTTSAVRLVSRLQVRWNDAKSRNPRPTKRQTLDDILLVNRESSRHNIFSVEPKQVDMSKDAAAIIKQELTFSFSAATIALQISNDVGFEKAATRSAANCVPLIYLSIRGLRGDLVMRYVEAGLSSQFSGKRSRLSTARLCASSPSPAPSEYCDSPPPSSR
jgi:hypothetical protein